MKTETQTQRDETMTRRIEWSRDNRQYTISYSDGVEVTVEATRSDDLRAKALKYHRARKGEVTWTIN
jgi:hypothetical protein